MKFIAFLLMAHAREVHDWAREAGLSDEAALLLLVGVVVCVTVVWTIHCIMDP